MDTEPRILGHVNKETKYVLDYFDVKEPKLLNAKGITGIPIVTDNNKYVGIITAKDIARELIKGNIENLDAKYDNIIDVLEVEEVLKFDEEIKGNILVAAYKSTNFLNNIDLKEDNILIVGDRHSIIENAINKKIKLLVLTGNGEIKKEHLEIAKKK